MVAARTVTLPVNPGASWDDFAWDPKYPGDVLDYQLDATEWLDDAGQVIASATAALSPGLVALGSDFVLTGNAQTGFVLRLSGGLPLTIAQIAITLTLDDGRLVNILVALPIRAGLPSGLLPYVPPGARLSVGGTVITIGSVPIVVPGSDSDDVSVGGLPIAIFGKSIII